MIRRSFSEGLKRIGRQNVSLFSIPVNVGQPLLGPDKAPTLIKSQGLMDNLDALNWKVTEFPEITGNGFVHPTGDNAILSAEQDAKNCAEVGYVCEKSYNTILPEAKKDDFILILGGDHCIPIGTIPAIKEARNNLGIVWVDAHADINTPAFSGSGNMHGMPVAFLMDLVKNISAYPSMEWFKPCLTPKDVVYIGLRDLDQPEKETIKKLGIKAYTMREVDRLGIGRIMEEVTDFFKDREHIHLSYDIDALDPVYAPSTGTAVRGGLTFREGIYICEELYSSNKLTSMEIVEVNPNLHGSTDVHRTVDMALKLISSAMGADILDINNRHVKGSGGKLHH